MIPDFGLNESLEKLRAITSTSSESNLSGYGIEESADSCRACHAPYGHYGHCPTINRASAEAHSTLANPSDVDIIFARGLGIDLTK